MKNGIAGIVVLFLFCTISLEGTAQTFLLNANGLQLKNLQNNHSLKLKIYEFGEGVILAHDSNNNSNLTISEISQKNDLLSKNYTNSRESNCFSEMNSLNNKSLLIINQNATEMKTSFINSEWHNQNRRNIYSGIWTYASLNYLYCDLAAFMDADMHSQYHTGTVDGFEMTPGFIAASAVMMQVALTNVFLPQVIKNDKTLRWVQIASGTFMTLIQSATLFVDKPTPYYAVFSGFEIAATAYISLDAIRWKPKKTTENY